MIGAYIRVSTKDQNPEMQLEDIKKFILYKWPGETPAFYIDHGESGAKTSRPEFDRMMNDVRTKKIKTVITWKFDRIGRSSIHLIQVLDELKALNVDFISIKEQIDTASPMGKMIFTIFAALAEFERETIKMRVKSGIENAQKNGVHCGRPKEIDDSIRQAVLAGQGVYDADYLSEFYEISRATVYRIWKENA